MTTLTRGDRNELTGPMGYALRQESGALTAVNPALRQMILPWSDPDAWWRNLRQRIALPAPTECPTCGLAQTLGSLEVTLEDPSGKERCFDLSFSGHAHGLVETENGELLMVRETTVIRHRMTQLNKTLTQYESLCESIEDVYYRTDMEGKLVFISPSCRKMIAFPPDELVGKSIMDLCIDPEYWSELMEQLNGSEWVQEFDMVLQCRRGNHVPVSINARVVKGESGERLGIEGIIRDITEREQLDNALAERTRKLQETMAELEHQKFALDQHAIVTVTDAEGKITYANRKMVEVSQFALDELRGRSHAVFESGMHPKSFFKEMWRTIMNGRVWRGEMCNRRKDGALFWVDCTIVPFMTPSGRPYQYVAISTDVSDRMLAEKRLEQSRGFLLSIADAMGEGVYVLDLQGRLTFFNQEAERLLGWREADLLGRNLHELIHYKKTDGTLVSAEECPVHRSLLGRTYRMEEDHFIRKDGAFIPVSYITAPLMENGEITGSVAVFQEISQRQSLLQELLRARDAALEASRLKSEFLANMSHEIRTPMNAIVGMNDLLMDTPLNDEQREFAEIVKESAESLLSLINDILDFSKIEAGKIDLEELDFAPVTVVEGSAELLASQVHDKGLSLMTFISPAIPVMLKGDPGRLRQMLLNLLGNAIKFTDEGEVVVRAWVEEETPRTITLHFSVSDSGIGLSRKARQRLFQPFTQADGETFRKFGGTGLGLAISKRLVELMGGEIGVESVEGEGSTFWFRIPFKRSAPEAERESEQLNLTPLRHRSILLLADRASDREILEGYLTAWGLRCVSAQDEEAAIAALRDHALSGRPFHAVLADISSTESDGLSFAQTLDQEGLLESARLIGISDADDKEWETTARQAGFAACLSKPVRQSELVDRLVEVMAPEQARDNVESFTSAAAPREPVAHEPDAYEALESGKLLLLVEDNPVNQKVALMQLRKLGYAAHAVSNGKEAVEAVSHLPYALILMDCQMPVMDGFEATHAIRKWESVTTRHIPIIAMTANAMKGDRERCINAGMDDYLSKPVSPEDLKKKLEYWIPKTACELPTIEINQLHQLFGHNEDEIRDLLHHFLPSARELIDHLLGACQRESVGDVEDLAHEMKGACANLGAAQMAQVARRLERLAAAGDWQEIPACLDALERAFHKVEEFVRNY
ncbi:MAG: PAS domain S-box protein [Magnetococcales bacterium]|nr:PAS domain S-box protein [Magnetococcales bacterium]